MKKIIIFLLFLSIISSLTAQWKPLNNGIYFGEFSRMSIFNGRLFLVEKSNGVYISDDFGKTWIQSNNGLSGLYVLCFAKIQNRIFAGTSNGGVYISDDNGDNWMESNDGINTNFINTLASSDSVIYAGSNSGAGVYVSFDLGRTWKPKNTSLTNPFVKHLVIEDDKVYAATEAGLYVSSDFGSKWTEVNSIFNISSIKNLIVSKDTILCNNYVSSDKGKTWKLVNNYLNGNFIDTRILINGKLYTYSGNKVYSSINWGDSWNEEFTCIYQANIDNLFIHKSIFFVFSSKSIFKTSDKGSNWELACNGFPSDNILNIAFTDDTAYLTTESHGVFSSTDSCKTWKLYQNPSLTGSIITIKNYGNYLLAGVQNKGVFLTTNKGINWSQVNNGLPQLSTVLDFEIQDGIIYTALNSPEHTNGIFISTDTCASWKWFRKGWSNCTLNSFSYMFGNFFAATNFCGIFKLSLDSFEWSLLFPDKTAYCIANDSNNIYACGYNDFYMSLDKGNSWNTLTSTFDYDFYKSIFVNDKLIILGGTNTGIKYSHKLNLSWTNANNGLTSLKINKLVLHNNSLYAATGNGLYYIEDINNFEKIVTVPKIPFEKDDITVYPNPAFDNSTINLTGFSNVKFINIIDLLGRTIYSENIDPAYINTNICIDLSKLNINPGTYFVVSDTGKSVKFVVTSY